MKGRVRKMNWSVELAKNLKVGDAVRPINHRGPIAEVIAISTVKPKTFTLKIVAEEDKEMCDFPLMNDLDTCQPLKGYVAIAR
jgi:hypothetical protein